MSKNDECDSDRKWQRQRRRFRGREAADLHGQPRDHAARPARAGGDDALSDQRSSATPPAAITPSAGRPKRPSKPRASRSRSSSARPRRRSSSPPARPRSNNLAIKGIARDVPRARQPHHHPGHRAQGGARHLQAPGEVRLSCHLSAGEGRRPHRSRRPEARHRRQDHPGLDHVREQRDWRHSAGRGDRQALSRDGRDLPHRCGAGRRQDSGRRATA